MNKITGSLTLIAALALGACSAGSSTGAASTVPTLPSNPSSPSSPSTAPAGQASFAVTVPTRGPAGNASTISPLTQIVATITSFNGGTSLPGGNNAITRQTISGGLSCAGTLPCSFNIPAPAGTLALTVTAYAGSQPVATGSTTFTSTGAAGESAGIVLGGIVQSVTFPQVPLTLGTPSTQLLALTVTDPSGAALEDQAYANPFTLTDGDSSGSTSLQLVGSSTSPAATVTVASPSTQVQVVYTGGGTLTTSSIRATTTSYNYVQSLYRK